MRTISRRRLLGLGAVAGGLSLAACTVPAPPDPPRVPPSPFQTRQVWAHLVPYGLPDYVEPGSPPYGAAFPLDLVSGDHAAPARPSSGLARLLEAGFTALQVLILESAGSSGSDFVLDWIAEADRTWTPGRSRDRFIVAPCIAPTTPQGFVRMVRQYTAAAQSHPAAARVQDKLVVFTFAPRELSATDWTSIRAQLAEDSPGIFLIGDLQPDSSQTGGRLLEAPLRPYLSSLDATWVFDDHLLEIWPSMVPFVARNGLPLVGSLMPGYNRETSQGGLVDPGGTSRLRELWRRNLEAGIPWTVAITWNDVVEQTDIKPSSNWNHTRQDINRFYAERFRGIARTVTSPRLYSSSVSHAWPGQAARAEALVINPGDTPVDVTVGLVDATGKPVGNEVHAVVPPNSCGAATANVAVDAHVAQGRPTFLRPRSVATIAGSLIAHVTGAPILLYLNAEQAGRDRQDWYSVPAHRAIEQPVGLTTAAGTGSATVASPAGRARFLDLLLNTREAGRAYDEARHTFAGRSVTPTIVGPQDVSAPSTGFLVGRVITNDERVGYSDPIWLD